VNLIVSQNFYSLDRIVSQNLYQEIVKNYSHPDEGKINVNASEAI